MTDIGKCPWPGCGGEGKAPDILGFFAVQCQTCGACGPISPREDGAIAAWNRLATAKPPCDTELAALEAAARAATHPGPPSDVDAVWIDGACFVSVVADAECGRADDAYYRCHNMKATPRLRMRTSYRAFLETAHPAAILALIQRVREAEADAARFRWLDDTASYYGLGDDLRIEWRGSGSSIRAAIDQEIAALAALETAVREAMGHD